MATSYSYSSFQFWSYSVILFNALDTINSSLFVLPVNYNLLPVTSCQRSNPLSNSRTNIQHIHRSLLSPRT